MNERLKELVELGKLKERPFSSNTPLIGPLIIWLREKSINVATKWYLRPILDQQSTFNLRLIEETDQLVAQLKEEQQELNERLTLQDKDQLQLTRTIAELTAELTRLRRQIEQLEKHDSPS